MKLIKETRKLWEIVSHFFFQKERIDDIDECYQLVIKNSMLSSAGNK